MVRRNGRVFWFLEMTNVFFFLPFKNKWPSFRQRDLLRRMSVRFERIQDSGMEAARDVVYIARYFSPSTDQVGN